MSTHNIGFYEDLTKIIFELSSNIIKYTPYFFCSKEVVVLLTYQWLDHRDVSHMSPQVFPLLLVYYLQETSKNRLL